MFFPGVRPCKFTRLCNDAIFAKYWTRIMRYLCKAIFLKVWSGEMCASLITHTINIVNHRYDKRYKILHKQYWYHTSRQNTTLFFSFFLRSVSFVNTPKISKYSEQNNRFPEDLLNVEKLPTDVVLGTDSALTRGCDKGRVRVEIFTVRLREIFRRLISREYDLRGGRRESER